MTSRLWILLILVAALPVAAAAQSQTPDSKESASAADTTTSKTEQAPAKESPSTSEASAHVVRAVFATDVAEREPVDELDSIPADLDRLYFFTEIVDMEGEMITHQWWVDGEMAAEVPIEINGPRWRVHSTKTLPKGASSAWTVRVLDDTGAVLHESEISGEAEPAAVTG